MGANMAVECNGGLLTKSFQFVMEFVAGYLEIKANLRRVHWTVTFNTSNPDRICVVPLISFIMTPLATLSWKASKSG